MARVRFPGQLAAAKPTATALRRAAATGASTTTLLLLVSCTHVAPYERGILARPDMTAGELGGPAEQHVRDVHEGAVRRGAVAESGCGCN